MENKNILTQKKEILEKLSKRQLKDAFELLFKMVVNLQDWQMSERLDELETNYKYMLHYQFEGIDDPERNSIYNNILRVLYECVDDVADGLLTIDSNNIFYERLRINSIRNTLSLNEISNQLKELTDSMALVDLLDDGDVKRNKYREIAVKKERFGAEIFNLVFVSHRSDQELVSEYKSFIKNESIAIREKCLFVSALTMNLFHRFDGGKLSVLMELCKYHNPIVSQRALVGLVIVLQMYDVRWQLYPDCQYQLDSMSENETFRKSVLRIIKQLIRSRETEEISRKMTEEIIPEMMKYSSLAGKKLNMQDLMGETDFAEKNPEWKKELQDSGLANKLQEYSNLQLEGADVFHSTFAGLKSFPFFNEMSNWFLPFDINYSELQPLTIDKQGLNEMLQTAVLSSGHMCDSDKYSFAFSMLQIPESQRKMMLGQLGEESDQLKELQKDAQALNPKINEEVFSNQYIQSLYRFFKLYSYRTNFFDIFKLRLNFYDKKSIAPLIFGKEDMLQIANYCFDKNFFSEALSVYQKLLEHGTDDSYIWQKIGYSKQMLNNLEGALDAYLQAELLAPQSTWIIKRIAQVYRTLKDPQRSLEYYQRASQLKPDNLNIELNIGHCYLELGEYDRALNCYFKVEVLESNSVRASRPIAWTAFLLRRFDVSRKYYGQILNTIPNAHDFLNAGHVELCDGEKKCALIYYLKAVEKLGSFDQFIKLFEEDSKQLVLAGVDSSFFPIILDEIRYKLD